jgi:hypothetical protein
MMFRTEKSALDARNALTIAQGSIDLCDDFGQELHLNVHAIGGWMFEDLNKTKMAFVERTLHQTRIQMEAQKAAESDPGIATAMRMRHQPSVITPFMPNGPRPS